MPYKFDLADVKGQLRPRRALEIAAAGGHSLLFKGPPGTGKTLLASRLPSILPPLSTQETLEVASIYSISNTPHIFGQRPFRAPHHTASAIALVGGGCDLQTTMRRYKQLCDKILCNNVFWRVKA